MPRKDRLAQNEYERQYRAANAEKVRKRKRDWKRRNRLENLEKERAKELKYERNYRASNPDKMFELSRIKRAQRYGLSADEYDAIIASANGKCNLCERDDRKLVVDHCHASGKIRGVLCTACNTSIGKLGDTYEALIVAAEYIRDRS